MQPASSKQAGPAAALRRQLRTLHGVKLWQIEEPRQQGQRVPTIRYMVMRGGSKAVFNRPHEAWQYFQQLTGAPDKDDRPEPRPIEDALNQQSRGTKRRRPRKPA